MKNLYDVIRRPLITEKSSILKETQGTLCFEVHRDATKPEIKKAVEQLLGTKVADVRVSNVHGKLKRQGRYVGPAAGLEESLRRPEEGRKDDRVLRAGLRDTMALKQFNPTSPGRRFMTTLTFEEITKSEPEKALTEAKKRTGGRNNRGRISIWFRGAGTSAATGSWTSAATSRTSPPRSRRSNTTPTAPPASPSSTTWTGRSATSSPPRGCRSARPCSRERAPTSSPATRCP